MWRTRRSAFADRTGAGRRSAERLAPLRGPGDVVPGLPRGGVPVTAEVARVLGAPLDVLVVRKLGVPHQRELAMGAVGEGGVLVLNDDVLALSGAARSLREEADDLVVLETPADFVAVGQVYAGFRPVPEEDVMALLGRSAAPAPTAAADDDPPIRDEEIEVAVGPVRLAGHLTVPEHPVGVVVFAHGSGSGRHSPRNRYVAHVLQEAGLATLLFDLLTPGGEADRANVFAVELLADRLTAVLAWVRDQPECRGLPLGLFGASTGAGAALWAAAAPDADVGAVVSRGGRPDLASSRLDRVRAATLLIVGGRDDVVLQLNEVAATHLRCEHRVVRVSGATHLFEEPGTLELASRLARDWFVAHLARAPLPSG